MNTSKHSALRWSTSSLCCYVNSLFVQSQYQVENTKFKGQSTKYKRMPFRNQPILHAYVSLGSNLGDRAGNLLLGVRGLMEAGLDVIRLSSVYETEPVGTSSQPPFLNMVAELRGNSLPPPEQMLARMLRVEYALGRTREAPMAPRTLDLDLLLYKNEIRTTQFLSLPHPRLHIRRFVLAPLAELAPKLVHPTLNATIAELYDNLEDQSAVVRWRPIGSQLIT